VINFILRVFCCNASFEAFTAVMFQVEVFRVATPCGVVARYRRFSTDPRKSGI